MYHNVQLVQDHHDTMFVSFLLVETLSLAGHVCLNEDEWRSLQSLRVVYKLLLFI